MEYLRSIFMKPGGSSSFFEVFFHRPFIFSPSFRSFTFVLLVLAQLDCFFPFLRLASVCWFVSQITSRENVTLLVPAMKRRRRVAAHVSAAVYRLSNVLLRGSPLSA